MSGLTDRVQQLVTKVHGGSINAAAKAMDLKQSTLHRIVTGQTKRPSPAVLSKIAEFYDVPVEWLVTGKGRPPKIKSAHAEWLEWRGVLRQLRLSNEAAKVLWILPNAKGDVAYNFVAAEMKDEKLSLKKLNELSPAFRKIERADWALWIRLFRELISVLGPEGVRRQVEENLEVFRP